MDPAGASVAIAATDGLALFTAAGAREASLAGCPGPPSAFVWSGSLLAAVTAQGRLCAWHVSLG